MLCVMTGLPNPPLTAGSFPATILVEDGGLNRLYRFDLRTKVATIGESGDWQGQLFPPFQSLVGANLNFPNGWFWVIPGFALW